MDGGESPARRSRVHLESLAELFSQGDPRVARNDEGFFLEATALDGLFDDGGRMSEMAGLILAQLNGVARLRDPGFRRVRLQNRFVNDVGARHAMVDVAADVRTRGTVTVVVAETAEVRLGALNARVAINGVVREPEPEGPRYTRLASASPDVAELLALVGDADKLNWIELYKAFEIVRDAVGRGRNGLIAAGWITEHELGVFTGSANHPAASGADARHARQPGIPAETMPLAEGQRVIRNLAARWFDSMQ